MIEIVRYRDKKHGARCALLKRGPKWNRLVVIDQDRVKVVLDKEPRVAPLTRAGKPYPLARAVREFRRIGRARGITKGALSILREAS